MKTLEEIKASGRVLIGDVTDDGFSGEIHIPSFTGTVIASTGAGWDHVSVCPYKKRIIPSWEDMCMVKDIFFYDSEAAIQIHPPKSEYVNNMPNCLHLWKCNYKEMVLPPAILVGIPKNMKLSEIESEMRKAYELAGEKF